MRFAILGLVFLTGAAAAQPQLFGAARVVNGDTVEIAGQKVRLLGLDAPEGRQMCQRDGRPWRCGDDAAAALRGLTAGQTVRCDVRAAIATSAPWRCAGRALRTSIRYLDDRAPTVRQGADTKRRWRCRPDVTVKG